MNPLTDVSKWRRNSYRKSIDENVDKLGYPSLKLNLHFWHKYMDTKSKVFIWSLKKNPKFLIHRVLLCYMLECRDFKWVMAVGQ